MVAPSSTSEHPTPPSCSSLVASTVPNTNSDVSMNDAHNMSDEMTTSEPSFLNMMNDAVAYSTSPCR
uniref:Uncharacterized protein n=1 Tax=Arundo donax TaxID=35708 RepID=A0A0A9AP33_ARUDO